MISQHTIKKGSKKLGLKVDKLTQVNRVFIDVNKISTVFGREAFKEYSNRKIQTRDLVRTKNRDTKTSERYALIAQGYGEDVSFDGTVPQKKTPVKSGYRAALFALCMSVKTISLPQTLT